MKLVYKMLSDIANIKITTIGWTALIFLWLACTGFICVVNTIANLVFG